MLLRSHSNDTLFCELKCWLNFWAQHHTVERWICCSCACLCFEDLSPSVWKQRTVWVAYPICKWMPGIHKGSMHGRISQCSPDESKQRAEVNVTRARKRTSTDTGTLFAIVTTGSCSKAQTDTHFFSCLLILGHWIQYTCFNCYINWIKVILDRTLFRLFMFLFQDIPQVNLTHLSPLLIKYLQNKSGVLFLLWFARVTVSVSSSWSWKWIFAGRDDMLILRVCRARKWVGKYKIVKLQHQFIENLEKLVVSAFFF